jgi:hypothetical protein
MVAVEAESLEALYRKEPRGGREKDGGGLVEQLFENE